MDERYATLFGYAVVNANGKIFFIKEKATPMSEELIIAPEPAMAVVELNAGDVEKHGIKIGDTVKHHFSAITIKKFMKLTASFHRVKKQPCPRKQKKLLTKFQKFLPQNSCLFLIKIQRPFSRALFY